MQLSPHFSYEEMIATQVRGLDNTPPDEALEALRDTAMRMEAVRQVLTNQPIIVHSGYRSEDVNRIVGGVPNSAHTTGHAVDFVCPQFGTPLEVARALEAATASVKYDQLIREYGWVHISFAPAMRGEVLTKVSAEAPYERGLVS